MNHKKKNQNNKHQGVSFENMVSKAALAQLGPEIAAMINQMGKNIGSSLAKQSANTFEQLYKRVRSLEELLMEKLGVTAEELAGRIADMEDRAEGLVSVKTTESGDLVRLEIKTKTKADTEYQGASKLQIRNVGSGAHIGIEVESQILGMSTGETKEIEFGENKEMQASIYVERVSRKPKVEVVEEAKNESSSAQG